MTSKAPHHNWFLPDIIQNGIYFRISHASPWSHPHDCVLYCPAPQPNETFSEMWSSLNLEVKRYDRIVGLAVCLKENDLVAVGIQ